MKHTSIEVIATSVFYVTSADEIGIAGIALLQAWSSSSYTALPVPFPQHPSHTKWQKRSLCPERLTTRKRTMEQERGQQTSAKVLVWTRKFREWQISMPTDMIRGTVTWVVQKLHTSVWQLIWHYFIMNPSESEQNKISSNFLQMETPKMWRSGYRQCSHKPEHT